MTLLPLGKVPGQVGREPEPVQSSSGLDRSCLPAQSSAMDEEPDITASLTPPPPAAEPAQDVLANESASADEPAFELPGIAERRAQARLGAARTRGRLWVAEPAIALLVGAAFFVVLSPTGLLLPLLGDEGGTLTVSPAMWALGTCAALCATGLCALRLRRLAGGKTDPAVRHLRTREALLILLAGAALALLTMAVSILAPPA